MITHNLLRAADTLDAGQAAVARGQRWDARSCTCQQGWPALNAAPRCTCPRTGPGPPNGWRSEPESSTTHRRRRSRPDPSTAKAAPIVLSVMKGASPWHREIDVLTSEYGRRGRPPQAVIGFSKPAPFAMLPSARASWSRREPRRPEAHIPGGGEFQEGAARTPGVGDIRCRPRAAVRAAAQLTSSDGPTTKSLRSAPAALRHLGSFCRRKPSASRCQPQAVSVRAANAGLGRARRRVPAIGSSIGRRWRPSSCAEGEGVLASNMTAPRQPAAGTGRPFAGRICALGWGRGVRGVTVVELRTRFIQPSWLW
jgi:hypothetical protein